ncbi:TetR/AcrR family transcriptional regulator [Anaerotignum sp. MSJ-24]|uniref:TetR/AcrR family transcriptional regulator n=1 Tax=Anaerotignum sp. MSJ-24 TaxID=2841521 RepID=UPI001C12785D|nr:TetR family transcriptional regulator [Anaerotignum sp. MSJ-24]MBU5463504.1 TetR/AcrR family transcriptional regulator [Anaerotignum sp. MSJ-24]
MEDTKEKILLAALRLFANDGYEAVSVSEIAGELGITKGALYKHYKNKKDIFDSIVKRMEEMDFERAVEYEMPEEAACDAVDKYKNMPLDKIKKYAIAQFSHWTEEEFSSLFRKMLTVEQYRSREMLAMYHQYLGNGPLDYMKDIFEGMAENELEAEQLAIEFYAPMYMLYGIYDNAEDKRAVFGMLERHLDRFIEKIKIGSEL